MSLAGSEVDSTRLAHTHTHTHDTQRTHNNKTSQHLHDNDDDDDDGPSAVSVKTNSSGSVRVGAAPPPSQQQSQSQSQSQSHAHAQEAKRRLEEQLAAIKQQLMALEPVVQEETHAIATEPTETETTNQPPADTQPTSPTTAAHTTQQQTQSIPPINAAQNDAAPPLVDLTDDATMTPAESTARPTKKRKSQEPAVVPSSANASIASLVGDATVGVVVDSASVDAAPSAKKSRSSSSAKKESAEDREARKAAEKAVRLAEAEAKKEAQRKEAEARKAEKAREAEEKREAHRREVEEKKAERQREIDAKKAEKEALKNEKQKELDAKREAKQLSAQQVEADKEAKRKEAESKKKALEKSQGFMSSFFKIGGAAAATPATNTPSGAAADKDSGVSASVSSVPSGLVDSPAKAAAPSERELARVARQTAVFLPYTPDRRVWTREHARLTADRRAAMGQELVIDFECTGQPTHQLPNWLEDEARLTSARATGALRRQRIAAVIAAGPKLTRKKKLIQFHDNYRPAWYGRIAKTLMGEATTSQTVAPVATPAAPVDSSSSSFLPLPRCRRPLVRWSVDPAILNYDVDSDDDWGEEPDDGEELASEDDDSDMSDADGEIRGDGLEEDGWLVPEDQDPLADQTGGKATANSKQSKGNKARDAAMVPIIVGPFANIDAIARAYAKEQAELKTNPAFHTTITLTEDMKDIIMLKKRFIAGQQQRET